MSDEQETTIATETDETPQKQYGIAWGDEIDETRKQELWARLRAWWDEEDHGERKGPFAGERLTGAEVFWLAVCALAKDENSTEGQSEQRLRRAPHDATLSYLCLQRANLTNTRLDRAILSAAHLEGTDLSKAYLPYADLTLTHLERATLSEARLNEAIVCGTKLQDAILIQSDLQNANLTGANLGRADLTEARLDGAFLGAVFDYTNLQRASLDKHTRLDGVTLVAARLDATIFDNTNLSKVNWGESGATRGKSWSVLLDERIACQTDYGEEAHISVQGKLKDRETRREEFQVAARAYRGLAVALQTQGMNEEANHYTYRAQIMQRKAYYFDGWRSSGRWLFSWLLAVTSGYGYHMRNILLTYAVTVLAFAGIYFVIGIPNEGAHTIWQAALDALLISFTAIHGRIFLEQLNVFSVQDWVAAVESVFGIVIESIFAAMLIQRFFNR